MRITIITFAWPPRNSIGAHRPWSWAKYWSEAGVQVRVLTARKYSYDEPLDLDLPPLPGVEVIETDYVSGSVSFAALIASSPLGGIVRRIFHILRGAGQMEHNPREKWFPAILPKAAELAQEADIVVSTYDPRMVHQIGAAMKQSNPNLVWVADYRDLWSLNHISNWTDAQRIQEQMIEQQTVGKLADMVCSVSEELARQQGEFIGKPWLPVTNGFDVNIAEIAARLENRKTPAGGVLNIVYTGKIYEGLRDPSPLFNTIADMEDDGEIQRGEIVVNIYGGQVEGIESIMKSGRYNHFVTLQGHVSRDVALEKQCGADLLLLLESPLPEARGVLTGKIFEYISAGVPILSLGSRWDSEICRLLNVTRTGFCAGNDQQRIRSILTDTRHGHRFEWFAPQLKEINRYSRRFQANILLKRMKLLWASRDQISEIL